MLHFQDYVSNNGREQYIKLLNHYFDYSKVREDLFSILMQKGSLAEAKRRARRNYEEYIQMGETAPSAMVPVTRVFELVEELERYLEIPE